MEQQKKMRLLTEGPIVSTLLALAVPIMASSFLSTAYNIMDLAWVGMLGANAVAGVGVGGMYLWFSSGIVTVAKMGGQVHVAQSIGRQEMDEARKFAKATIQIVVMFALIFSFVCLTFTRNLVEFYHLNDAVAEACAMRYTRITSGLIIFSFMNVTLAGISTAQGDSKTPLIANFTGLLLNMVLDPVLILGIGFFPRLEDAGAAIATVSAQAIVLTVMATKILFSKKNILFQNQKFYRFTKWSYYKKILVLGFPAGLQSLLYCFISMILGRFIARFGSAAYAVQRVGGQIESLTWNMAEGFGSALNAFCGQNFGAGKYDRIRKGYKFSWITIFAWGSIVALGFILFPRFISGLFFHEEEAITISIGYLIIVGLCEPFMCVELLTNSALCGLGLTRMCSMITISLTALRIPTAYILQDTALGVKGIWWALSATSIAKGIVYTIVFLIISKRLKRLKRV